MYVGIIFISKIIQTLIGKASFNSSQQKSGLVQKGGGVEP